MGVQRQRDQFGLVAVVCGEGDREEWCVWRVACARLDGADRDGDVSERLAVAQLHDGVVNALRRADDDRRISEALAFTPVAVQEPACEPPFDDGEHQREYRDERVEDARLVELEQVVDRAQHDEIHERCFDELVV